MHPYKKQIKTQFREYNQKPSLTIPDNTMSIPELISRYAKGLPLGGQRTPIFDEDPENDILDGRDWRTYDLSEQRQIVENAKLEYEETISRLRNTSKKPEKEPVQLAE